MRITRTAGALLPLCLGFANAGAQIVTDGSMGAAVTLTGPDFQIGEALGTRLGSNLFHSFADFNVQLNQSATFTSNFAGTTSNVISRVTGGNVSVINGLLASDIAGADVWLINPNGLVFGENAVLDVPAGFHASTADLLTLADGGSFRATNPNASSLTIAPPSAFGFLDASIGSISVDGATLAVGAGHRMSFVGGAQSYSNATLTAVGGRIDLVGAASAGDVAAVGTHGTVLVPTNMTAFADIEMNATTLQAGTTTAQNGGTIGIVGGDVTLGGASTIDVSASSSGDAGRVALEAATGVTVWQSSDILANSTGVGAGAGSAGSIEIAADSILVALGSTLSASTVDGSGTGAGGEPVGSRIDLRTNDLLVDVGSELVAQTTGAGQGGSISVTALDPAEEFSIRILEESSIQTGASGTGDAGSIQLGSAAAPADLIRLAPGVFQENSGIGLFSNTVGVGPDAGDAGSIEIHARELTILGANISVASGTFGQADAGGDAGSIDLHVGSLNFTGRGASISGETNGTGDSGSITVSGDYSDTPTIVMIDGVMTTRSRGSGNAGRIVVGSAENPFESIVVRDPFPATSLPNDFPQGFESTALGTGDAGDIEINARSLVLQDGAEISTSTADGSGGEILLRVEQLQVERFSRLTASTSGAGDAGDIVITGFGGEAAELVLLTGTGDAPGPDTGIFSNAGGSGAAGDITIAVRDLIVEAGSEVSANTRDGIGGVTTLLVNNLVLINGSAISGSTDGVGDAGDIVITGIDANTSASTVTLAIDSSILSLSRATGPDAGAAGNVEIHAGNVQLALNSGIIGNNVDGTGGTVTIRADDIDLFDSQISVIGLGQGDAGDISISGAGNAAASRLGISGSETAGLFSSSGASGADAGAAGSITVNAADIDVRDRGAIVASTVDGAGGAIEIQVDRLRMTDSAGIGAGTFGDGDAGQILIRGSSAAAAESVLMSGGIEGSPGISTGAFQAEAAIMPSGDGGDIQIVASSLELHDEASISSSTSTLGSGGTINLQVDEVAITNAASVTAATSGSGNAGSIVVTGSDGGLASLVSLSGPGSGFATDSVSRAADGGLGGSIDIAADQVLMQDQSSISSSTAGGGAGGSIELQVDDLQVLGGSVITASTLVFGLPDFSATGTGDAGSVVIHGTSDAASVFIDGAGSAILSTSSLDRLDAGSSGDVTIQTGQVEIINQGAISVGTVGGEGGNITIEANELNLRDGAALSVRSTGAGRAGSVFTDLGWLFMSGNSQIDATATSSLAGNVELNVSEIAFLQDSLISGLSADPENDGGNFIIQQPEALVLQRSSILANSGSGTGGNISITADAIVIDVDSNVEATGEVLAVGEVLGSVLQLDPPVVVDAAAALDTSCATQQADERSSMIVRSTPPGAVREPYLPADASVAPPPCRP